MPRLNNGLEILKGMSKIEVFQAVTTSPGDQAITDPVALADATVTVAAITAFSANDPVFIIGDGGVELNAIGTPATTMPLLFKAAVAQSAGARLLEAVARNIGHVDENGVQYSATLALTPIDAATSITPLAYQKGSGELSASFGLRGHNNLNMQLAHGSDEGEIGTGVLADPHQVALGSLELGTHSLMCVRVTGYRFDLKTVTQDYLNCTIDVQVRSNFGGRTPGVLPVAMKFERVVQRIWG